MLIGSYGSLAATSDRPLPARRLILLFLETAFEHLPTSKDLFKKSYENLSAAEQKKIHYTILEAAGRDDAKFTKGTKKMLIMGKLGVLVTAALATYQILNAENKPKETARQGIIVGGGALGGVLAGMGVSAMCGPGAPICAVAVVLVGSVAGGVAGGAVADSLDEELEEFSHWDIF